MLLLEVSGASPDDPDVVPPEFPLVSLPVLVSSTPTVVPEAAMPEVPVLVSLAPVELEVPSPKEVVVGRPGEVLPSSPVIPTPPVVLVLG